MKKTLILIGECYQADVTVSYKSINYKDLVVQDFKLINIDVLVMYNQELDEWFSIDTNEIGRETTVWKKLEKIAELKLKSQYVSITL